MILRKLKQEMRELRMVLAHAEAVATKNICFKKLATTKKPRNERNALLKGIGVKKLNKLIAHDITNGRQLLQYEDDNRAFTDKKGHSVIPEWQAKVRANTDWQDDRIAGRDIED
jgi:hypothetical protein